jgi:integration host factor subunit alpha
MQKNDIAQRIHQEAGISEEEAATLLNWVLELFKATLQRGEPIAIPSFGKFMVRSKATRLGRNPRTGEAIMIAARRVVLFHPSLHLKAEMTSVPAANRVAVMAIE